MKTHVVACMVFLLAVPSALAQADKLVGVWKLTEFGPPVIPAMKREADTNPQPEIWIFTQKYCSIMGAIGEKLRPDLPEDPTEAQLLEAWRPFNASTGTYEVSGSTITILPIVDKNPNAMNSRRALIQHFRFEGDTLIISSSERPPGLLPMEKRFTRLE